MSPLRSTLLLAALLQALPPDRPASSTGSMCPEVDHIELAKSPLVSAREICVSPGILTGVIFDLPVEVDIQEELRFMNVLQGRSELSFRAPQDLAPGERLRLTAKLGNGEAQQTVTFFLVAHPGHATHQVEVYHDSRPRESFLQEIAEEHAKNQRLQGETQRLLEEVEQARLARARFAGLTGAYLSNVLDADGIRTVRLPMNASLVGVSASRATSYRANMGVAIEVIIHNASPMKWTARGSSLLDGEGNDLGGLTLSAAATIEPHTEGSVFVEVTTPLNQVQETFTLKLFEDGPRTVTVPRIIFPP